MSEVKERPIIMSGPMVRAILDGRKTETRRVVKGFESDPGRPDFLRLRDDGVAVFGDSIPDDPCPVERRCPYGVPGDLLWVRETFATATFEIAASRGTHVAEGVGYRADGKWYVAGGSGDVVDAVPHRWKPAIHMPKRLARLWLEITELRVERLQEIDEVGALAEGCVGEVEEAVLNGVPGHYAVGPAREAFRTLWDALNAKRGYPWADSPWVWVIEFRRIWWAFTEGEARPA